MSLLSQMVLSDGIADMATAILILITFVEVPSLPKVTQNIRVYFLKNELQDLTTRMEEKARAYGMEVSTKKSKVLVNSPNQPEQHH